MERSAGRGIAMVRFSAGPRDESRPMAAYQTLKVCLVKSGGALWKIDDREYTVARGDIVVLNNRERRAIPRIFSPGPFEMLYADFEPGFLWGGGGDDAVSLLDPFFARAPGFANRIGASEPAAASLEGLLLQMELEFLDRPPYWEKMLQVKLMNLLLLLNRHCAAPAAPGAREALSAGRYTDLMTRAASYLERRLAGPVTLGEIAGYLHVSPSHFSRIFKRYNGLGFSEYLTKRRIQKAMGLIGASDERIVDIAFQCGYETLSSFYKAFHRVTGHNPSDYRDLRWGPGEQQEK